MEARTSPMVEKYKKQKNYIMRAVSILSLVLLSSCSPYKSNIKESDMLEKISEKKSFIVYDLEQEKIIKKVGDCQIQESPCSTFKIALSLMGFDSCIFKNENEPEWPYKDEYKASFDFWRQPHTPKTWMKNSCVWYSQVLTSILGMDKFKKYVESFEYGNQDVSGNPGKNDGLSRSWLCSSLKISPQQQIDFIKKLLSNSFPVSNYAHDKTKKILFKSDLGNGWKLYAKTGGGANEELSVGWFIGWIANDKINKTYIFACLLTSKDGNIIVGGNEAKDTIFNILNKEILYK